MNALDGGLLLAGALIAMLGWRIGLVCALMSLLAVVAGGGAGFLLGTQLVALAGFEGAAESLLILATTIAGIFLAQVVATKPAQQVHDAVTATPLRPVNSASGAVLTVGFGVVIVWMLATALALAPANRFASLVRGSVAIGGLDRALPSDAGMLFQQLEGTSLQKDSRVFTGLGLVPLPDYEAPPTNAFSAAVQGAAEESVVRIVGQADCGGTYAGSGVVVGDDLVLTNAHVVAGMDDPAVFGHDSSIGEVGIPVLFDPARDAALIRVPGLDRPALRVVGDPDSGDYAAVAGYPNGGPLEVSAARVRGITTATGSDIYGTTPTHRDVVLLSGTVVPGNSGGPLLSMDGDVVGLVFASATQGPDEVGYALSPTEAQQVLAEGWGARDRVDTGHCDPDETG